MLLMFPFSLCAKLFKYSEDGIWYKPFFCHGCFGFLDSFYNCCGSLLGGLANLLNGLEYAEDVQHADNEEQGQRGHRNGRNKEEDICF